MKIVTEEMLEILKLTNFIQYNSLVGLPSQDLLLLTLSMNLY